MTSPGTKSSYPRPPQSLNPSKVFSYVACCVPEIGADARVDDGDVEEKSLILESRVVVEECPCLRCDVHT